MRRKTAKKGFSTKLKEFCFANLPNRKDNFKQAFVKIIFLVSLIVFVVSAVYLGDYFSRSSKQKDIIDDSREIWYSSEEDINQTASSSVTASKPSESPTEQLLKQNGDFKGWVSIRGTNIDNPVYQAKDNDYYLNHNQNKQKSDYGALYFDCNNKISAFNCDKNLVIYGHHMKDGTMFADLRHYKSLSFYKAHPTVKLTTLYGEGTYKIYAAFVLNAKSEDDGGNMYNIYKKDFSNETAFNAWVEEARERSVIITDVDVNHQDDILTLVTCDYDFDNARFVVMARKIREGESTIIETFDAKANPNPRYPKRWYDERNLKYPFSEESKGE